MNDIRDVSPIQQDELQQGLSVLQTRRNKMSAYMVVSSLVVIVSLIALFFNQSLIYAFFEVSTSIQQLHIPVSAIGIEQQIGQHPNYFGRLLNWVMWFGLKTLLAVIGATLLLRYAPKINFFRQRMQNFIRKFFVWILSIVFIWSGLSIVQSEINENDHQTEEYAEFIAYKNQINQSDIYQYLARSQINPVVQDYLLAQTALLHASTDKTTALAYLSNVIHAEREDTHFMSYGFKPEQLWVMQNQLYGKAVTPLAQSVQAQVEKANQIASYTQWLLVICLLVFALLSLIFYGLTRQFNRRLSRIESNLN